MPKRMPPEVEQALVEILRWRYPLVPVDFYMVIRDELEWQQFGSERLI